MNDANVANYAMTTEEEREEYLHSDIINFYFGPDGEPEWGFSMQCNALYKIDIQNATADYVSSVLQEKSIPWAYCAPLKIKNRLLLCPIKAQSFAVYDIDSGNWAIIPVPADAAPEKNTHTAFGGAINCGDCLLIGPGTSGVFAKYDIESGEFSFYDHWINKFKHHVININGALLFGSCYIDGKMYLASPQCNVVTELNPKDMSFVLHQAGKKGNKYCGIAHAKDSFWLIKYPAPGQNDMGSALVEWCPDTGKCVEHADLPVTRDECRTGQAFSYIIAACDDLYLFPWHSDNIIKFDPTTKKSEIFKLKPEFSYFESKGKYYDWGRGAAMPWVVPEDTAPYPWKKVNSGSPIVYIQSPTDYSLIKLNLSTGEYTKKKWRVNGTEHLLIKIYNPDTESFTPRRDTVFYSLGHFVDDLVSGKLPAVDIEERDHFRSLHANGDCLTGKNIYECVKKLVL